MKTISSSAAVLTLLLGGGSVGVNATALHAPGVSPSPYSHELPLEPLDRIAMESTRGGVAPLALALGVAGLDIALMGFYWGVYVPYYAPKGPSFYTEMP